MTTINDNYLKLKAGYLFPEIGRRVNAYTEANPNAPVIKLGIGDVTEPLPAACREAMITAVQEMGDRASFRGYGPEQGYLWLREANRPARLSVTRLPTLTPPKYSYPTVLNATVATSLIFLAVTIALPSPIRCIRCM